MNALPTDGKCLIGYALTLALLLIGIATIRYFRRNSRPRRSGKRDGIAHSQATAKHFAKLHERDGRNY